MTGSRHASLGLIDRSKPLRFTFDGKPYVGFQGDTLASALLANGVRILGRSFKYHRPRGIWGAWFDDPNAIFDVTLGETALPNCSATTTALVDGMQARAVNAFPSAAHDIKGGLDLFHRWLSAGFYYKTFIWPDWHLFEPTIRKMAGLGQLTGGAPVGYESDQQYDGCDLLVVGAGPAGLVAARKAAEAGQDVVLVDDHPQLGGSAYQLETVEGQPTVQWIADQETALRSAGARILTDTTAFGVFDHSMVGLAQDRGFGQAPRLIRMRAGQILLATGALDRPLTFANNDRPGVMSLAAGAEMLARYGTLVGRKIAVLSNNSQTASSVASLRAAGADVTELPWRDTPLRALGRKQLKAVEYDGQRHTADTLLVSGGQTPIVHLWRHAGGKLDWDADISAFVPGQPPDGMTAIGGANGRFDLDTALAEARGETPGSSRYLISPAWPKPGSKGRQWIDFQHDVTLKDVELAARENYVSVEHLKRYTTLGMAADQGKTSNMAGLAAMAAIQNRPIPQVGTTTFRPPFVPVPMELYHGHHRRQLFHPLKRLPLEQLHRDANAALGEYGGWLRPGWYGSGNTRAHIEAECRLVRQGVGLMDASPLGKIEVMGPDAESFVNFLYYNTIRTLKPGQIRYGFMLTEGGVVYDDGVISRIDQNRFVISCSSSHVDGVRNMLESWRQDGNDPDRIFVHDTTQHWATLTVTGPKARDVLMGLDLDIDLSGSAFPHMTFRETLLDGTPLRIARVSFTGELSYELSIRAGKAADLWQALLRAGAPHEIAPFGVEALSILRAEKGFIIVGKDTDGETMPHDLGFGAPRLKKSVAFVGDRGLHTEKGNDPDRRQLVGLAVPAGAKPLTTGAHLVTGDTKPRSLGIVTSSYDSPTLGHPIALALLERGADRHGENLRVWHMDQSVSATVCAPCVYDPEGGRMNA